jgi:uncharacterized protein Smg (DUF494 family)
MTETTEKTTEQLALEHFEAQEHFNALRMMNTPTDYEERKKSAVQYALAQEALRKAEQALFSRTQKVPTT